MCVMSRGISRWFNMVRNIKIFTITIFILFSQGVMATMPRLDFSLHKLESDIKGPTILVIGGIQGDEPGGFNAAALLVTDYKIKSGNVWVVPNLNFESIIKRSRGVYGDMNRKFLNLKVSDPEYSAVQKIKSILRDQKVDLILNLHDGSGFYRKKYIDKLHNSNRWGQSIIIDQAELDTEAFGNLNTIASKVTNAVNKKIKNSSHSYQVKNTRTRDGDKEMEKSLTYFAIQNKKPAFGLEVSKQFPTHERVYYHLVVVEEFLSNLGVEFERGFNLTKSSVKKAINDDIKLSLYDSKIFLDIAKARNKLGYVPMKKDSPVDFVANNPLVAIVNDKDRYKVRYGNREMTRIHPEDFEYDFSLKNVRLIIDGEIQDIPIGSMINVDKQFLVEPRDGYRVNVIGYRKSGIVNETGIMINRSEISKKFSIDRDENLFRVEFYREKKFCGMLLLNFKHDPISNLSLYTK